MVATASPSMVILSPTSERETIVEPITSSTSDDVFTDYIPGGDVDVQNDNEDIPHVPPLVSPCGHVIHINGHVTKDIPLSMYSNGFIPGMQNGDILPNHPSTAGLSRRKSCSRRSDFQASNDKTECQTNQLCQECRSMRFRRQLSSCSSSEISSKKNSSSATGSDKRRKSSLGSLLGRKLSFRFLRNLSYSDDALIDTVCNFL